jgi:hypothetical protein
VDEDERAEAMPCSGGGTWCSGGDVDAEAAAVLGVEATVALPVASAPPLGSGR